MSVVIKAASYLLIHVPDFVQYGSKPSRDLEENEALFEKIQAHLRSYDEVLNYPPHQVFIGNKHPDSLNSISKPWYEHLEKYGERNGPFGEIMPEDEFYGWMKAADDFDLLWLETGFVDQIREKIALHPGGNERLSEKLGTGNTSEKIEEIICRGAAKSLFYQGKRVGALRRDHDKDDTLKPIVLMENLMAKASGSLAMLHLLNQTQIKPEEIDFVLDCTETAIGDRYNRGGGSMSKAMAEMVGCINATGNDTRAFCCAPNHSIINAAGLVGAGIYKNVVVAAGGCLAKVGMKSTAHLKNNMPILEDVIAGMAFLICQDDGLSPIIRLDGIGKHDVGAGTAQEAIMTSLVVKPLAKIGLKMTDIDKYATELHNPEITLPAGSGDTPDTNYKLLGALAVLNKQIDKTELLDFVRKKGMPGFCPTQGHIPSAVPFIGHAISAMRKKELEKVLFLAKGSLFLGRMSQLSDGISFLLEANPNKN